MRKGEATRQAILAEAARQVSVQGFGGISIAGLASGMGLSKSGLFAHFGSKEALQQALMEDVVEKYVARVIHPALARPRGRPRLEALIRNWFDWQDSDSEFPGGCPIGAATFEFGSQPGPIRDWLVAQQHKLLDLLTGLFAKGVELGHFRPGTDPRQAAFELNAIAYGYRHASRLLGDPDARARAEAAVAGLLARLSNTKPV